MARKQDEGLKTLIPKIEPIPMEEIRLQDWYAAFALLGASPMATNKEAAVEAWDRAEEMIKERARRM